MKVGILCGRADTTKGLWRDMQCVLWALRHRPLRFSSVRPEVHVFPAAKPSPAGDALAQWVVAEDVPLVAAGYRLDAFVAAMDVVITFEGLALEAFEAAHAAGTRCVFVPNVDWAVRSPGCRTLPASSDTAAWCQALRERPYIEVWAKQPSIGSRLAAEGVPSLVVPWSVPDPVRTCSDPRPDRSKRPWGDAVAFFVNAGHGGYLGRRSVDAVIRAFVLARQATRGTELHDRLALVIKTIKPLRAYAHAAARAAEQDGRVHVLGGFLPEDELRALQASCDAVVHVSKWEGFGLPLLEALHAGLPVITHSGWPVGDLVEHGHNGLVVDAEQTGVFNLAPIWRVDEQQLSATMCEFASDAALRDRLTFPTPGELRARQYAFVLFVQTQLLGLPPARAIVIHSPLNIPSRRSELYWCDALEAHGYDVLRVPLGDDDSVVRAVAACDACDLVLAGKPSPALLRRIRPFADRLLLWHHDSPHFTAGWTEAVRKIPDHSFVPYADSLAITLHPGPRCTSSRGYGRREVYRSWPKRDLEVSFIGRPWDERASILGAIAAAAPLKLFGPGFPGGPVWDASADDVYRRSSVALSISRYADVPLYTSNRLFHASAVGAPVVAQRFPGLEQLYPEGITTFETAIDAPEAVLEVLQSPKQAQERARVAERHTWNHHTWFDRVHLLLSILTKGTTMSDETETSHPDDTQHAEAASTEMTAQDAGAEASTSHAEADIFTAESTSVEPDSVEPEPSPAPPPTPAPPAPPSTDPSPPSDAPPTASPVKPPAWRSYWDKRAREHGTAAVTPPYWAEGRQDTETGRLWSVVEPHVVPFELALDFGVGVGRFAERLQAAGGGDVVGLDVSQRMLDHAAPKCLEVLLLGEDGGIPVQDDWFDMLFCCTVLQHVPDDELPGVVAELHRVLRSGAHIVLVENTTERIGNRRIGRTSRTGHVVFRPPAEYVELFPGLEAVDELVIDRERHHVFVGTLRAGGG